MQFAHSFDSLVEGKTYQFDLRLRRHLGYQSHQHAAQSVASYGHDARPARHGGRMGRWQDECIHSANFMISKVK
jgi:hypothetical protein